MGISRQSKCYPKDGVKHSTLCFFTAKSANKELNHLMKAVKNADYQTAFTLAVNNPALMFEKMEIFHQDQTKETLSPLQFAFKVYDSFMWDIFKTIAKRDTRLWESFVNQANEPIIHLDLEPLIGTQGAYHQYQTIYSQWTYNTYMRNTIKQVDNMGKVITHHHVLTAGNAIGEAQRLYIPMHMFREMCRRDDRWRVDSTFDTTLAPTPETPSTAYELIWDEHLCVTQLLPSLGNGYLFIRGKQESVELREPLQLGDPDIFTDWKILIQLYEIRQSELSTLRSNLSNDIEAFDDLMPEHSTLCTVS